MARQTAYQALKDACDDLFARQFSYQEINERGILKTSALDGLVKFVMWMLKPQLS